MLLEVIHYLFLFFLHYYTPSLNSILIFLSFFPLVGFFFFYNSIDTRERGVFNACLFRLYLDTVFY